MKANPIAAAVAMAGLVAGALPASAQDAAATPAPVVAPAPEPVQAPTSAPVSDPAPTQTPGPVYLEDSASPFGPAVLNEADVAKLTLPDLNFKPTPADEQDFDKYYYFTRADTTVAQAYADLSECDGYARGLQSGITYQMAPYPYTFTAAGVVGGAIGNALAMAIFGSAEKRRLRRVNMRACMGFKGYQRHGLRKSLWEPFNFEEGLSSVKEVERQAALKTQALVAATVKPATKALPQ